MRQAALAVFALLVFALGSSASALDSPKVIDLLDISRQDVQPINGFTFNRLPRAGDQFPIHDDLYKWAPGGKRGALAGGVEGIGEFQFVGEHNAKVLFFAQARLQGGSVVLQGMGLVRFEGPSTFTLPIVGGTGIYANARGYVVVRDLGNGNGDKSNAAFHLLP
jgi:hypothetical protein